MQKCFFKHGKHTSNMMFFTKFAISPVPGADFQGEVLILPSEVLQSNLSGQVGLLFSCPSSQVVNLWGGYHLQKICQDVTESHACSKYQWQPLKRFFWHNLTFSMMMHFSHKKQIAVSFPNFKKLLHSPDGCQRATRNSHCKQCYLLCMPWGCKWKLTITYV